MQKTQETFFVKYYVNGHSSVMENSFPSREDAVAAGCFYAKEANTIVDYFVLGTADCFGYVNYENKKYLLANRVLTKNQVLKLKRIKGWGAKYRIFKSKSSFFVKGRNNIISVKEQDVVINRDRQQIYPSDNFKRFNRFIYSVKTK